MPEISNNLGVILVQAKEQFKKALAQKPDYIDAKENLKNKSPKMITCFPFRYNNTRTNY